MSPESRALLALTAHVVMVFLSFWLNSKNIRDDIPVYLRVVVPLVTALGLVQLFFPGAWDTLGSSWDTLGRLFT